MSPPGLANVHACGAPQALLFALAVFFGTGCSICSKTMMGLSGTNGAFGEDGDPVVEDFRKPLFQTFGMFVGMMFGMPMHWAVLALGIQFPGYGLEGRDGGVGGAPGEKTPLVSNGSPKEGEGGDPRAIPAWMYYFLAVPAIFDLAATALCMMGLQYLDVSIYQMLRGSGIVFVALMKQHVLKEHLNKFHWVGVFWNVMSVVIVGAAAILASSYGAGGGINSEVTTQETFLGVCLLMAGSFVQALQYVFEERVMTMDVPAPPLLLIGMEGLWGTLLGAVVMYPIGYYMPGDDHGSYEDPFNTWAMLMNSRNLQVAFVIYFFTIFLYNLFAVLVTFTLSSIWHAILDNFRPLTTWAADLFIFYRVSPLFGEAWTSYGYLQAVGMAVLVYGTAIYNAPNEGSLLLGGQWWALGLNFEEEYEAIRQEREEAEADAKWDARRRDFGVRKYSSFVESPKVSVHTQALRGIGAQHN